VTGVRLGCEWAVNGLEVLWAGKAVLQGRLKPWDEEFYFTLLGSWFDEIDFILSQAAGSLVVRAEDLSWGECEEVGWLVTMDERLRCELI